MPEANDPTAPICLKASQYPDVDEGTACTQNSFKANKKAFLYIGQQGGRYKAMFKLQKSIPEASKLAQKNPDDFQVGSNGWVTARFSFEAPLPKKLWEKWLEESHGLCVAKSPAKKSQKGKKKAGN